MKKFEYKIIERPLKGIMKTIHVETQETLLTGYGLEGWRMHQIMQCNSGKTYFLLEREIEQN